MSTSMQAAARGSTFLIESVPSGARVIDDMVRVGVTPHRLDAEERRSVLVAMPGYEPQQVQVVPGGRARVRLVPEDGPAPAPPPPETAHSSRTRGWDE
jgi:hypothetical protein